MAYRLFGTLTNIPFPALQVHGITYLGFTFEAALHSIYLWLESHPTEALIIQLKEDRTKEESYLDFANAVFTIISERSELWRTADTLCSLGELRGRIQLFRRFLGPEDFVYGVDVTRWQDNPVRPFTIDNKHGVHITVQDHYSFPHGTGLPTLIQRKGGNVAQLLQMANRDSEKNNCYINFTSAYELAVLYQIPPHSVAVGAYWGFKWESGMNIRLRGYLQEAGKEQHRYGIIVMGIVNLSAARSLADHPLCKSSDFPEQGSEDLIKALILTNFHRKSSWVAPIELLASLLFCIALLSLLCSSTEMHMPTCSVRTNLR